MSDASEGDNTSPQTVCVSLKKTSRSHFCSTLKMFILSLAFTYFTKTLSGTYMKSAITQIERRFDLSSTHMGIIDGSFEMGNLLFLAFVSYYGAKLHRPKLIGCGCFLMSLGCVITGLPHFFMGRYRYDTIIPDSVNQTVNVVACQDLRMQSNSPSIRLEHSQDFKAGYLKEPGSNMWVFLFLGNALRGIGETPLMPLGITYIDDFARAENSAFYIACLQAIALMGPVFGYLLGSFCARMYVDVGFVDTATVTITSKDARWVGAWWLGFLVSSVLMLLAGIPFCFFPRSLRTEHHRDQKPTACSSALFMNTAETAKGNWLVIFVPDHLFGFFSSLKKLLSSPVYILILCEQVLIFSSLIGYFTFKAKYMEQHFGVSSSKANLLIGLLNLPISSLGTLLGGLLMKKYKLGLLSTAWVSFLTTVVALLLLFLQFMNKCDNIRLAGLTISYNGTPEIFYDEQTLFSQCNQNCSCSVATWDPVCFDDGITYMSPCLAGCTSFTGQGKNKIFHNCSCVLALSPVEGNTSVSLGQCPHTPDCGRSLTSFMVIFGVSSFVKALGITPLIMLMIRSIYPELKSLAIGIHALAIRALAGIPSPVYYGSVIDSTCLKWSMNSWGNRGTCRFYETSMYRIVFLSLMTGLYGFTMLFDLAILVLLRNQSNHEPTVAAQDLRQTNQDEVELRNLNEHSMECSTFNTPEPQAALVKTEKMCNDD
ncbi:solute carrier organic anion transporter family member 1C1-like [Silurus meridionalis]|uniref:solute carrier organic anion transporter family member 1C1-like n=1 Tax=Silurus meridionalis TaxID=175797 RepID=UPI001EEB2D07|nr:solute carrier organic anion transporter family member 1C1-like [Silurus meridionalis]